MQDELTSLIRDRFAGHEAPVDPGAWQAIQAKLSSGGGDELQELFQERFTGHESPVDPSVWANISSQLGLGAASTSGSASMVGFGWAAAGVGVLAVVGAAYLFSANSSTSQALVEEPATVVAPRPNGPVEEAAMVAVVPTNVTERSFEPLTVDVVEQPARPAQASGQGPATRPAGPEASIPSSPETLLPEPGTGTIPATPEGPAIVESIISQITEKVKADVESSMTSPGTPDVNSPSDALVTDGYEPDVESPVDLPQLFLPNSFTPNGDGVNDTYEVSAKGFARMMIRVYSVQNNQLVFRTDSNEPWSGSNCIEGYYLVAVEALTEDGRLVTKGSVVWLNRTPVH